MFAGRIIIATRGVQIATIRVKLVLNLASDGRSIILWCRLIVLLMSGSSRVSRLAACILLILISRIGSSGSSRVSRLAACILLILVSRIGSSVASITQRTVGRSYISIRVVKTCSSHASGFCSSVAIRSQSIALLLNMRWGSISKVSKTCVGISSRDMRTGRFGTTSSSHMVLDPTTGCTRISRVVGVVVTAIKKRFIC